MSKLSASSRRQAHRLVPFVAAALLPYALLLVLAPEHWRVRSLVASAALTVLVGTAAVFVPWVRLASWTHVLPPLGYLIALALLRDAGSGAGSGVGVLALLPVFWLALYGTRSQLRVLLGTVLVFFLLPIAVVGGPEYPLWGVRTAILFAAVASIVGVTVQDLVGRIRVQGRERDALMAHLAELAYTDALTGLPNRRAWTAALADALAVAEKTGEALTVAMVDLDHFKAFNDRHGHESGDALLAESAAAWREGLRPTDVVARLGGDEFGVLLPGCRAGEAPQVLERVLERTPDRLSCSVGYAEWDRQRSASALVREADRALYEAKRRGGAALASST